MFKKNVWIILSSASYLLQVQILQLGLLVQMGITHSMQILQIVLVLYSAGILYRSIWHVLNLQSGTSKMKHAYLDRAKYNIY